MKNKQNTHVPNAPFDMISDEDLLNSNSNFDRISKILPAQENLLTDENEIIVSAESPFERKDTN